MGWIAYVIAWFAAVADLPELKFGPTKSTPQYVGRNFSSGNREQGLNRWQDAIRLFEQEQKKPNTGAPPAWGHAEAWAWLGGAYLTIGRPDDARKALEEAVRLRPDFWWAARAALPQARRPITK